MFMWFAPFRIRVRKGPESMEEINAYRVEVRGELDESAFNATSPLRVTDVRVHTTATRFAIRTDQSGLIGLLRHLHGQGFILLSVNRER
jgi:hypothetical protein